MDDLSDSSEQKTLSIQYLPFFFSHFFMLIIIIIATIIGIVCANYQTAGPFYSSNETLDFSPSFNSPSLEYPYFFSQLSDIHLTHAHSTRTKHILEILTGIANRIKPYLVIITGDIADASDSSTFLQPRKQYKLNWDEYNKTLHESGILKVSQIFEVPGNHDIYNVEWETSEKNYFPKYTQHKVQSMNVESFLIEGQFNFISINPVKFPYISAPLGMMPYTSTSVLNEFETHFINDNPSVSNIIISHYPHYSTWTAHPSKMEKIYSKARLFLSGHFHPRTKEIVHYGKLLHVVTPPTGYTDYSGLITIEKKSAIVYHQINALQDDPIIVVTYPVPIEQLSNDQVFNKKKFPVRVISFTSNVLNLELYIDNNLIGKLNYNKALKNNVLLYSCDLKSDLAEGKHTLKIEGDAHHEMEFFIGEKSPKITETMMSYFTPHFFFGSVAAISFLILIRLIPFWLLCNDTLDKYENYMYYGKAVSNRELEKIFKKEAELKDLNAGSISKSQKNDSDKSVSSEGATVQNDEDEEEVNDDVKIKWYHQIYLGPLYMICRLRKTPLSIYIVLIILFIWYIPLPFYFTKIESKLAILWCWGYISDSKLFQFNTPLWFLLLYDLMLLFPLIDVAGMMYEGESLLLVHKIEFALLCIVMAIAIVAWVAVLYVAGGAFSIFTSFMLYFALFGVIFIFCRVFIHQKEKLRIIAESSY